MSRYYTYLISSLPALQIPAKAPFSRENFLERCQGLIPDEEIKILRQVFTQEAYTLNSGASEVLKRWSVFDLSLRNELAKARASRLKIDPLRFVRGQENAEAEITHIAMSAFRNTSILEAEKFLDQKRWEFLDALSLRRYFDLDVLIIYALKLTILTRWDDILSADKTQLFTEVLAQ